MLFLDCYTLKMEAALSFKIKIRIFHAGLHVLTQVLMTTHVFWDAVCHVECLTQKMEAQWSSKMLVTI
jgi:hypothetical protein